MASLERDPPPSYAAATAIQPDKPLVVNPDPAPAPEYQIPAIESVQTSNLVNNRVYETSPIPMVCPYCRVQVTTVVDRAATQKTYLVSLLLFAFGCWCCACIPCCLDSCKGAKHYCPSCGALIGTYMPW